MVSTKAKGSKSKPPGSGSTPQKGRDADFLGPIFWYTHTEKSPVEPLLSGCWYQGSARQA